MAMLRRLRNVAFSLLFPPECEACGGALSWQADTALCPPCESAIRWIRPPHCPFCGRTCSGDASRCGECAGTGDPCLPAGRRMGRPYFDRAYACTAYEGPVKELLHAFKFERRKSLGRYLADILSRFVSKHSLEADAVMAVPLDPQKQRQRGFNQSEVLSARLSRALHIPHISGRLKRREGRQTQSGLAKHERQINVEGAFEVTSGNSLRG